jgi:hypothetical protein
MISGYDLGKVSLLIRHLDQVETIRIDGLLLKS